MRIGRKHSIVFQKKKKCKTKIKFLQCRCQDANAEISKWPHLFFELCAPEVYELFGYRHTETIEYFRKVAYFLRKNQTSRAENWKILRIKKMKFLGYCFYVKLNIKCIFKSALVYF